MIRWPRRAVPLGQRGEKLAARALKRAGYTILNRNVYLGRYEVDIIAREGDTVAFVEVKTRRDDSIAKPEDNVTVEKQRRLSSAAAIYIANEDDPEMYYRFDIVSVLVPEKGRTKVVIYRDAFPMR